MKVAFAMLLIAGALATSASAQQNSLETARDLYASARYDEALLVLNGLRPASGASDVKSIEQYRSLCLLALGRGDEAEAAISAVISADPFYQPSEAEASPRVRAAFADVRQRQLPQIARARYASAKEAFDRKDYAESERQFRDLLRLIQDPDVGGRLEDLRMLAQGFLDLSVAAAAPPPPPAPPQPAPVRAPEKPAFSPDYVFSVSDKNVVPPIPVKQEVPRVSAAIASQTRDRGVLELVIDEQGRVTAIELKMRLHPAYDTQLMSAAKDWRYRPAMMDGRPVKYRKLVQVSVVR
jgi:hypothetical protein